MTYAQRMEAQALRAKELMESDPTPRLTRAVELLRSARHIIVGAGAGLSAAGGLDYFSHEVLVRAFPAIAALGYPTLWDALWDPALSHLQRQGMVALEALWTRYDFPVMPVYYDLKDLLAGRDFFIFSSNIDDQFLKAGFPEDRLFCPQNSIADFQCSVPCCDDIWDGEAVYRNMAAHLDPVTCACRPEDLPRCPHCGAPAVRNMRGRDCFLPRKVMALRPSFERYWADSAQGPTVFLELGIGFNSPGLIRHPFQRMTALWPQAALIRVNRDHPLVPDKIRDRSVELSGDIAQVIHRLLELDRSLPRRGPRRVGPPR